MPHTQNSGQAPNTGPFSNLHSFFYWTGTAYAPDAAHAAWYFNTVVGKQDFIEQYYGMYAVAVRPGDVFSGYSAPEPGTLALLILALAGSAASRRRKE